MVAFVLIILAQSCGAMSSCANEVVGGQKVFMDLQQYYANYMTSEGEAVSAIYIHGARFGGVIAPTLDGNSLILRGSRSSEDPAAEVIIKSKRFRTAGGPLAAKCGDVTEAQQFALTHEGNLVLSACPNEDGSQATDVLHRGMIVHGNGASGARMLQSAPGLYMTFEYRMAEACALLPDGGQPSPDGGTEVQCSEDGGCCFAYAAKHGGVTIASSVPQLQGWQFETHNPGVYGGASKFVVHATGAFGQANGLTRAQFPTCPSPLAMTSLGQFYPGVPPGFLAYAADEDRHYRCTLCGWEPL